MPTIDTKAPGGATRTEGARVDEAPKRSLFGDLKARFDEERQTGALASATKDWLTQRGGDAKTLGESVGVFAQGARAKLGEAAVQAGNSNVAKAALGAATEVVESRPKTLGQALSQSADTLATTKAQLKGIAALFGGGGAKTDKPGDG